MDKPQNGGFICEKHDIGYKTKCPSCEALAEPPKQTKKQAKMIKQFNRRNRYD